MPPYTNLVYIISVKAMDTEQRPAGREIQGVKYNQGRTHHWTQTASGMSIQKFYYA